MPAVITPSLDVAESKVIYKISQQRRKTGYLTRAQIREIEEKRQMLDGEIRKFAKLRDDAAQAFETLKKAPERYIEDGCIDNDPENTIRQIEEAEQEFKDWRGFLASLEEIYKKMNLYEKLKVVDQLTCEIIAYFQEYRWWIMVLLANEQPKSKRTYSSAKAALASL